MIVYSRPTLVHVMFVSRRSLASTTWCSSRSAAGRCPCSSSLSLFISRRSRRSKSGRAAVIPVCTSRRRTSCSDSWSALVSEPASVLCSVSPTDRYAIGYCLLQEFCSRLTDTQLLLRLPDGDL